MLPYRIYIQQFQFLRLRNVILPFLDKLFDERCPENPAGKL